MINLSEFPIEGRMVLAEWDYSNWWMGISPSTDSIHEWSDYASGRVFPAEGATSGFKSRSCESLGWCLPFKPNCCGKLTTPSFSVRNYTWDRWILFLYWINKLTEQPSHVVLFLLDMRKRKWNCYHPSWSKRSIEKLIRPLSFERIHSQLH